METREADLTGAETTQRSSSEEGRCSAMCKEGRGGEAVRRGVHGGHGGERQGMHGGETPADNGTIARSKCKVSGCPFILELADRAMRRLRRAVLSTRQLSVVERSMHTWGRAQQGVSDSGSA
jgi:hypothetical protein